MNRYLSLLALVAVATPAQAHYGHFSVEPVIVKPEIIKMEAPFSESALISAKFANENYAAAMAKQLEAQTQMDLDRHALDQKIVTGTAITVASMLTIATVAIIVEWYKNLDVKNARRAQEIARIKLYMTEEAARAARNEEKAQADAQRAQEVANAKHITKVALAPEFQAARTQAAIAQTQHNVEQRKALDAANIEVMKAKAAQKPVAQDTNNQESICISSKTTITATA